MGVMDIGHEITPAFGTVRRDDGSQGSVLKPDDYPLNARCLECQRRIRVLRYTIDATSWFHLAVEDVTA